MNTIIDTGDIAESNNEEQVRSNMVATVEPPPSGISFHVTMRSWTQDDMEELIVEAAARLLLGKMSDTRIAKLVEEKVLAAITERADARIAAVAADVMAHRLTPQGYGQKASVTIGETLAHLGREYLEQKIDRDGKPVFDSYRDGTKRIDLIVSRHLDRAWSDEIGKVTNTAAAEIRRDLKARHEKIIAHEKTRLRDSVMKSIETL